jgi:hypothetical protein
MQFLVDDDIEAIIQRGQERTFDLNGKYEEDSGGTLRQLWPPKLALMREKPSTLSKRECRSNYSGRQLLQGYSA